MKLLPCPLMKRWGLALNPDIAIGNGIQRKIWAFFRHKKVQPYSQVCPALLMNKKQGSGTILFPYKKRNKRYKVCFHFFVPKKYPSFPSRFFIPIAKSGLNPLGYLQVCNKSSKVEHEMGRFNRSTYCFDRFHHRYVFHCRPDF